MSRVRDFKNSFEKFSVCPDIKLDIFRENYLSENYVSWLNDSEVNRFLECRHSVNDITSCKNYIAENYFSDSSVLFVIVEGEKNAIGTVRISNINEYYKTADIGYLIGNPLFWGNGIATKCVRKVCCIGFEDLFLRKITAGYYASNIASCRLLNRLGFSQEATLREQVIVGGVVEDVFRAGLFRGDLISQSTLGNRYA
ncbi:MULTISPECIES: GNAT family N-acetyltransferase [Thalassospira]|uniref:GNAT family N-acetyltransferase n=1 Tax=Thalassospira aquimaris TaxID=3037796 RepID=A0ABT6G6N3_9PROT|nr:MULTISPECIES: GNAT family N-acetyltransferase [Thalassospira]MDG4717679.1 GNAT family N-acetyltransferase [Thalassospira sp. FZY0004]